MFRQINFLLLMSCLLPGCMSIARLERSVAEDASRPNMKYRLINELYKEDSQRPDNETVAAASQHTEPEQTAATTPNSTASDVVMLEAPELAHPDKEFLLEQILNAPRGSQVGIHDESGGRYTGTVLRSGPDSIEIMNCMSQEAIPGPDDQQQCKTSHIPFQKIPITAVTHFITISAPPPGFPATDEEIDGTEYSVAEIVNRSGQRQSWGKPPVRAESR